MQLLTLPKTSRRRPTRLANTNKRIIVKKNNDRHRQKPICVLTSSDCFVAVPPSRNELCLTFETLSILISSLTGAVLPTFGRKSIRKTRRFLL